MSSAIESRTWFVRDRWARLELNGCLSKRARCEDELELPLNVQSAVDMAIYLARQLAPVRNAYDRSGRVSGIIVNWILGYRHPHSVTVGKRELSGIMTLVYGGASSRVHLDQAGRLPVKEVLHLLELLNRRMGVKSDSSTVRRAQRPFASSTTRRCRERRVHQGVTGLARTRSLKPTPIESCSHPASR